MFGLIGLAPIDPARLRPLIGHGSRAMIEAGLRLHGVAKTPDEVDELLHLFFPYYADNIAVMSRPFDGIPALLESLSRLGARLAVCTNKLEALSQVAAAAAGAGGSLRRDRRARHVRRVQAGAGPSHRVPSRWRAGAQSVR